MPCLEANGSHGFQEYLGQMLKFRDSTSQAPSPPLPPPPLNSKTGNSSTSNNNNNYYVGIVSDLTPPHRPNTDPALHKPSGQAQACADATEIALKD